MSPPRNPHERHLAVSGILVPVTTPFGADGRVAPDRLAENVARWESLDVDGLTLSGYVVLGSSGEAPLLTADERRTLIQTARRAVPTHKRFLVGTGAESTINTIARTREAAELGADGALVLTPSYYRAAMTENALARFYLDVAEASPIPILLYNVPQFTGVPIGEAVARHLKAHPNIVGIKDSSGNVAQVGEIVYKAPPDFHVLVGNAPILLPALVMGASGGMLAIANAVPAVPLRILADFRAGRLDAARDLQLSSLALARAIPTRYGIAGLKAAMDMMGYYGGPPRPPLYPAPPAIQHIVRGLLEKLEVG
jgi:4-hydroxy-2-oxoglutarate aldolase